MKSHETIRNKVSDALETLRDAVESQQYYGVEKDNDKAPAIARRQAELSYVRATKEVVSCVNATFGAMRDLVLSSAGVDKIPSAESIEKGEEFFVNVDRLHEAMRKVFPSIKKTDVVAEVVK